MFYCNKEGLIQDVNEAFCHHYGYSRAEVLGKSPRILRSRHSTDELYKRMWSSILDPEKGYWRGEIINRAKNGREIPLILTITAVRSESGALVGYVSNAVDISEQLALQERIAQSEALATIGEMAAVVAHEIRNPLGSIVMAANQLASDALGNEDRAMIVRVLKGESQRLNETLTNFLAFARPRELKLDRVDLNALVGEVLGMIQSNDQLAGEVQTELRLDPKLMAFPLDGDQIRQVLWNIALNAIQAMEGRGRLFVETGRTDEHAYFRIKDTGPGIAPDKLASIFKPFQTTKRQGTGLGLAIAERIVKAHGGRIEVASAPGQGASFTVLLRSVPI